MDYNAAIEKIRSARNILLTTHTRPDGDAIGSLVGLRTALLAGTGCDNVQILLLSKVADNYRFLLDGNEWIWSVNFDEAALAAGKLDAFDLVIVCDTRAAKQLPGIADYLRSRNESVVAIDHHVSGDDIGSCQIVETQACAAGEIVYKFICAAGWPLNEKSAAALYVAICTDTGWFRFENTTSAAMRAAGELIDAGARPDTLYEKLFLDFPPERLKLVSRALDSLELHCDNRLAIMRITNRDLAETGAHRTLIENIVNTCQEIGSLQVWVLLVEQKDGHTRCSFRSRGGVDVNVIANQFHGGGHARAAGATIELPPEQAAKKIRETIESALC